MIGLKHFTVLLGASLCLLVPSIPQSAVRNVPGSFDYYVLVLSWWPAYCQMEGHRRRDEQCRSGALPRFVLHGLWPQYEKGWPEKCNIGKRPWVPTDVIRAMRDIMPSKGLIIHEYRTHGTCSGLDPAQYFSVARELYERIRIPDVFLHSAAGRPASVEEIERAFVEANSWANPAGIAVRCRNRALTEIQFCFGRDLFPRACGLNQDEARLCSADKMTIPAAKP